VVYLDTCILIYAVEGQPPFQQRAQTQIATLQAAGHRFAVSDLTKYESLVKPLGVGDGPLLLDYERFFSAPNLVVVPLAAVYQRAGRIRAIYRYASGKHYSLPEALHLAAAIEFGCDSFLTNDQRLAGFPEITIDVLP
jgi:predicted nucleic acid-binding protein